MDAQFWMAAFCLQIIRSLVPFGSFWNDVLPSVAWFMNSIQATKVQNYFQDVVRFSECIKAEQASALDIVLTGHSLGMLYENDNC